MRGDRRRATPSLAIGGVKPLLRYPVVQVGGRALGEVLAQNGLARIYEPGVPLPDGKDSREYLAGLEKVEAEAKAARRGGWGKVTP